ncbi:DUF885 domain-containing protein [Luteimonas sp BLCC-B24]|uniref:DUF885 domain-containing protein n=1 Tax=Luteimonas sp. BLCC-B24 TaxID=3025317 RepID=UPI00234C5C60|nr:DUF885 domain-containing protein [Luteimonas sp. BLCC-B24]MDC7807203.1 DUF885 domain-containing protein [Luteimonas sp. BLCC-B24]
MTLRPRVAPLAFALAGSLLLAGCASTPPTSAVPRDDATTRQAPTPVTAFFDRFTDDWMRRQPNAATGSRYFDGALQSEMDRQLTPQTTEFRRGTLALAERGIAELARFDRDAMRDVERVSAELMDWQLRSAVEGERYEHYNFPLQQFSGANVGLPNLMTVVHPVRSEEDARNYLARLGLFETRMDEAMARARELAARDILPPRFILDATIAQMQQFIDGPAAANPLVTTFAERLQSVDALDAAGRDALVAEATRTVQAGVYPAWSRAIAELRAQQPRATDDAGLWRFADGADAYAYHLRRFTSTQLDAEAIHAIGLREVARIEGEMDGILRSLGRTEGSVESRVAQLRRDLAYSNDDAGRAAIMADIETMMRDAERRADALFDIRPKTPVIAQPYPEYRWASAAASYTAPPLDGSRPGVYQMPLRPDRLTRFGLRTLVYHEAVPGHHFQIALSVENPDLPKFRQTRALGGISAFSEGWALYAERLAAEEGWYEGDPEGRLGQLDAELFRARRLVVDTGLHAMRWTRQQAIDYGIPASEVDRYVVMPGQATSYMIGQLEIIRLRDKARDALGGRFDPRAFHNRVLLTGVVPLELLEREVDDFIAKASAG